MDPCGFRVLKRIRSIHLDLSSYCGKASPITWTGEVILVDGFVEGIVKSRGAAKLTAAGGNPRYQIIIMQLIWPLLEF